MKTCGNCEHRDRHRGDYPCDDCYVLVALPSWEPRKPTSNILQEIRELRAEVAELIELVKGDKE